MKKYPYYILFTVSLLTFNLHSWGSSKLPQLSCNYLLTDTIPLSAGVKTENNNEPVVKELSEPVIKKVPRSKKKLKPASIDPKVAAPPVKIIKPKVIIRRINVNIP